MLVMKELVKSKEFITCRIVSTSSVFCFAISSDTAVRNIWSFFSPL